MHAAPLIVAGVRRGRGRGQMRRYQPPAHVCVNVSSLGRARWRASLRSAAACSEMLLASCVLLLGLCHRGGGETDPPVLGAPRLLGPSEALLNQVVDFGCEVLDYPENETIHLQMYKAGKPERVLGESTHQPGTVGLMPMVIKESHDGFLECVARPLNASGSNLPATVSRPHYLRVIVPVEKAEIVYSGPHELFEGNGLELRCRVQAGSHVSYTWLLNGGLISPSPLRRVAADRLTLLRTSSGDGGLYRCVASNSFNATVFASHSSDLEIAVKELVSDPDISFTVLKESANLSALVGCRAARGAPPITFALYNRTEPLASVTVEERQASFRVPLAVRRFSGWVQCRANNSDQITRSQWLPLTVVPVKGPVTLRYDRDIGESYAVTGLRFYCRVAEGSHPRFRWFLNGTPLQNRGRFYYTVDQAPDQSLLLLSVGESGAGTYHCEVSDSFDNATAVRSNGKYVDREVLHRLPTWVVAVVFGCFTAIVVLVSVCCCVGVAYRRRTYGEKSLLTLEMERMAAYEGEMEPSAYVEDRDVLGSAGEEDFYQASEASADESP